MANKIIIQVNKETKYLPFVSETLRYLEDADVECMCITCRTKDGLTYTGYYNASIDDKTLMAKHIEFDVNDELIKINFDKYSGQEDQGGEHGQ